MKLKVVPPSTSRDFFPFRQAGLLASLTLLGWLAAARWPGWLLSLGISDYGTAYLDSYAILASVDAWRAGADVYAANPLDPLFRSHVYSDWWLGLRWLGLTRAHNVTVGILLVGVFGLTAWITVRPRRLGETFWLALVLVSPPMLLAVKRANNDLVIFIILALVGVGASATVWWRPLIALACLVLATGLKYFPATAALAFLWVRPLQRMPAVLLAALVAVVFTLASVWTQLDRARFTVGSGVYTMGAPLLARDLGWKDADSALPGVALIAVMGLVFAFGRVTRGLTLHGNGPERMRAAIGCIVLLTCFSAGMNYAYRWVFVVWPAIWLWRRAFDDALVPQQRWVARCACALIGVCLWGDGIFCLVVNRLPAVTEATLAHMEYVMRLWIQPFHWLLMFLFAGWLVEAGLASAREWWNSRRSTEAAVIAS